MEDTKVPRVKEFKYLESTQESGGCEREVKKRVQAGRNRWRKVSGVICNRRLPARVKGKVYSSVVRPAMMYGLATMAVTKKQVKEMEVAEMKMLRFAMGVTKKDKISKSQRQLVLLLLPFSNPVFNNTQTSQHFVILFMWRSRNKRKLN